MRRILIVALLACAGVWAWAQTPAPEIGTGLRGEYFEGRDLTTRMLARVDPVINYATPFPGLTRQTEFSVRWRGSVLPAFTEPYTFITTSDDGVRLWVNGQLLLENWTDHGPTENSGTVNLQAGKKAEIKIEFFQGGGGGMLRLEWQSEHQPRQVVPAKALFPPLFPEGRIAYQTSAVPQKSSIVLSTSSGETRTLTDPGGLWKPALSPDGSKLLYTSGAHVSAWSDPKVAKNTELYLLDLRTADAFPRRMTNSPLEDEQAAVSPDGKWVAFATRRDMTWELYELSTAVNKIKRITTTKAVKSFPAFSTDGTLLFFETNCDGQWEIYSHNLDDDTETRLTTKGGRHPSCSPDGTWVLFAAARDGHPTQLYKIKPDGSGETALTNDAYANDYPCCNPDGDMVLYQSTRDGKTDLYLLTLATGGITPFTTTGTAFCPTWSH